MGWMGREQVWLLLESGGLGLLLGVVFDFCCALSRSCGRHRLRRFLVDAAFGIPAALLTFYGALAMMDGKLHPLLFGGMLVGFWLQHVTVGRWSSRQLYRLGCAICRGLRCVYQAAESGCTHLRAAVASDWRHLRRQETQHPSKAKKSEE